MWFEQECRRVESLLWKIGEGKADDRQTARVRAHLRHCPACRAQWEACRQTQEGLAALRVRPVPVSQTDWHTVQARLAIANSVPATTPNTRREPARCRAAIFGRRALLTGAASFLTLCLLLARPVVSPRKPEASLRNEITKAGKTVQSYRLLKPMSWDAASTFQTLTPAFATAIPKALSDFGWTGEQEKQPGDWTPSIRRFHTRPYGRRVAAAHTRRRRRTALALLHTRMRPNQTALTWNNEDTQSASVGVAVTVRAGRTEPEYVLTTVESAPAAPRDFVMDSINVDAPTARSANVDGLAAPAVRDDANYNLNNSLNSRQNDIQNSVPANGGNAQSVKEIQAW